MSSVDDNGTMAAIFPTPTRNPMADRTWGEPEIVFHDNSYFLIYDTFPVQGGPACLMTSVDGVHWREEGAVLWPENPICIECVSIRRYQDDGPFVLSYDAHVDGRHVRRFAVSNDLRTWEILPDAYLEADERYYRPEPFHNHYPFPDPCGGWFAGMNACPTDFCGTGLGHSHNGIYWELLPAVPVLGVVDQQMGRVPGPGAKAVEMSAFFQLDGVWFILGGNPLVNADLVLSSSDMNGPFNVTPKNGILPRGPQNFHRVYSVPDGLLSIPMIWAYRERKYYHVAPLRRIKAHESSLWFTWWEGNDVLKRTEIKAGLMNREHSDWPSSGFRPVDPQIDVRRGAVVEIETELGVPAVDEPDLARSASVRASATYTRSWWPHGYFAPSNAVDGRETTSWKGSRAAADEAVEFVIDLGSVRTIGRIEVKWQPPPETLRLSVSPDGNVWHELYSGPPSEGYADWIVEHRSDQWRDLDQEARFIRFELTPKSRSWGGVVAPLEDHIVGLARVSVYEKRRRETAVGTTLMQATGEDVGYLWQIRPDGRVRFGRYDGSAASFHCEKERNIEQSFGHRATIRLVQRWDLVDLYVNDYQVDYYQLLGEPTGRFALAESSQNHGGVPTQVRVWYPD